MDNIYIVTTETIIVVYLFTYDSRLGRHSLIGISPDPDARGFLTHELKSANPNFRQLQPKIIFSATFHLVLDRMLYSKNCRIGRKKTPLIITKKLFYPYKQCYKKMIEVFVASVGRNRHRKLLLLTWWSSKLHNEWIQWATSFQNDSFHLMLLLNGPARSTI